MADMNIRALDPKMLEQWKQAAAGFDIPLRELVIRAMTVALKARPPLKIDPNYNLRTSSGLGQKQL